MTREEIWFDQQNYVQFSEEVLNHPLFIEVTEILRDKAPLEKRPQSYTIPNERAADQKHWDDGFRFYASLLKAMGLPPRPKQEVAELPPEYSHLIHPEPEE